MPSQESSGNLSDRAIHTARITTELRYWLGYTCLIFALRVFSPVLEWMPLMTHIKLLLVLWIQLPAFRGATRLLTSMVRGRSEEASKQPPTADLVSAERSNALISVRLTGRPAARSPARCFNRLNTTANTYPHASPSPCP